MPAVDENQMKTSNPRVIMSVRLRTYSPASVQMYWSTTVLHSVLPALAGVQVRYSHILCTSTCTSTLVEVCATLY